VTEWTGPVEVADLEGLRGLVGRDLGPTPWLEISQTRVDDFADAADDRHWAHNDPGRAAAGPFGAPIAHAHLTLALLPSLLARLQVFNGGETMFYGYDRVRVPSPVLVGGAVRMRARVVEVAEVPGGLQETLDVVVDVRDVDKPACAARALWRHYPADLFT
jgi:acyl dehydratase